LTGTGFTAATAVSFGDVEAEFTVDSSTQITATAPARFAGVVHVLVVTPSGVSAASEDYAFTYTPADLPVVAALDVDTGTSAGGTTVTISGTDLGDAYAVYFGDVAAAFTVDSAEQITATAPAQYAGTVEVSVLTHAGASAANAD